MDSNILKKELIQEIIDRKIDNLMDNILWSFPGTTFYDRWEKGVWVKIPERYVFSMILDPEDNEYLVEIQGNIRGDSVWNPLYIDKRDDEFDYIEDDDGIRYYKNINDFIYAIHMYFM